MQGRPVTTLAWLGVGLLAGALRAAEAPRAARPNILWLIAEDLSPDLVCYGAKEVWTPNLDRLAGEGVRYTRAFTTAPVCSASRSAFMTGMYQTTIGAHHHRSHRDDGYQLPEGVKVATDRFREAGYFTANIRALPDSLGFKGTGKTDWNFTYAGQPFDSDRWDDLKGHQPFYAQLNFSETHRRFHGPAKADPAKVELPPIYPDHPVARQDWAAYLDDASELDRKVGLVLKQLEADGLSDSTLVLFIGDHGQAHVRGKQFVYDDGLRIPLIIRWPSALPAPKNFAPGSVSDQLLCSLDLTATSLALAGVKKPANMQGRVFLGEQSEAPRQVVFGARDRCDETMFRFRTARDARYRYIKNFMPERPFLQANAYKERSYPVWNLIKELGAAGQLTDWQRRFYLAPAMPPEELYDMDADPHAMTNLVASASPEHQAALERLRRELAVWIEESNDQGRFPEPPEVTARSGATQPAPAEGAPKKRGKKKSP
jgi:arylsulfatase A-like enzyme